MKDTPQLSAPSPLTHRQILTVFSGLALAMLLGALDQTIVANALPTIVRELGGLNHLSWVVTAYLLGSTVSTPLWGKIGDLYGRKRIFQGSIVLFLAGSALSGLAMNMDQLIAFRAFQGMGAGGLMTLAMAIVGDIVAPRERGRYQGYIQAVFALASVAGPLLGGFIVDHASWRWVFYINLPVGVIALIVVSSVLHLPVRATQHRIDYLGSALLVAGVSALLLTTLWGGTQYSWTSPQIIGLAVAGVVLLSALVLQERRAAEPVVPLRLFREPVFVVATAALFFAVSSLFAATVFIPLFLQTVAGASATNSGLLLLPLMAGITVTSIVSGPIITRTGRYKIFPVLGLAMMTVGLFLLSRMDASTSRVTVAMFAVVFGLGFGLVTQVLVLAIQNAVDRSELGTATAVANFFRAMGGAIGVAVFGAVFTGHLQAWLPRPAHAQAVAHAIDAVFLLATPLAALGFFVVLFLKEYPLRSWASAPAEGGGR